MTALNKINKSNPITYLNQDNDLGSASLKLSKGKHKEKCHALVSDTNYFWQERCLLAS